MISYCSVCNYRVFYFIAKCSIKQNAKCTSLCCRQPQCYFSLQYRSGLPEDRQWWTRMPLTTNSSLIYLSGLFRCLGAFTIRKLTVNRTRTYSELLYFKRYRCTWVHKSHYVVAHLYKLLFKSRVEFQFQSRYPTLNSHRVDFFS